MEKQQSKYIEPIILVSVWVVVGISPALVSLSRIGSINWGILFSVWKNLLPFIILSLLNHFVFVPYLFFKKKLWYFLTITVVLILFSGSLYLIREHEVKKHQFPSEQRVRPQSPLRNDEFPPPFPYEQRDPLNRLHEGPQARQKAILGNLPPYIISIIIALLVLGFDTGMRSIFRWVTIEREHINLEKEKVKSELAFLRNQVSPHFFMNTLNNIHALIDVDTEEAKEALIRLSKLMRHLLYDSEQNKIALAKEIDFIRSYIDLMKLRFTERVKINFSVDLYKNGAEIPPLLFTSLIENAFKFGVSYLDESFIDIQLTTTEKEIVFRVKNSITTQQDIKKDLSNSGIGLENTRKRFDLLYGENYKMDIIKEDAVFSVQLNLPL